MNEWFPWVAIGISAATLAYTILSNRGKDHKQEISDIKTSISTLNNQCVASEHTMAVRVDAVEDRTTKIEQSLLHVPSRDVTHRMEVSIAEMKGDMHVLAERLKPVSEIATRLQEYMLDRAGAK